MVNGRESLPGGAIVYLVFRRVRIRGLEQHGPAAGGATKAPVGLLLVRGSQPVGMSNGRTAVKIENPNLFSIGEGFGFFVFFGKQNAAVAQQ